MQSQSNTGQGVGSELLSGAKGVSSSAVDRLHTEVDARKDGAATQAKSVSSAIQQAAGGLDNNAPVWLKSAFEQGAQQVQKFAEALEQKDSRQLVTEVSDFAQGSPGTFLTACAAAGFAAARIFKAGGERTSSQSSSTGDDFEASNSSPSPSSESSLSPSAASGDFV